jgi:Lysyl oxidase
MMVRERKCKTRVVVLSIATALSGIAGTGAAAAWTTTSSGSPTPDSRGRYLPDVVEILPGKLHVYKQRSRTLLTFSAAANNFGPGPLIIRGSRPSKAYATMSATQIIRRSDGKTDRIPNVGTLRYERGGGHNHWHLVGFMRFELRTPGGAELGRRDHKQGFCLGDRYDINRSRTLPGEPSSPVYRSNCGRNRPGMLQVKEGISVGYGDGYGPKLEGQFIDVTGLPSGRYTLVQRVDPNHRLLDAHTDNNVSSLLFKLERGRHTRAKIVKWCSSTARCS